MHLILEVRRHLMSRTLLPNSGRYLHELLGRRNQVAEVRLDLDVMRIIARARHHLANADGRQRCDT